MRARFGDYVLDTELRQLLRGGEALHLTPKAFGLLEYLVERRPRALPKSQILERIWPATFVSEANLASLVKEIRRALGDDADGPRFIRTVRGFGYAFAAEVVTDDDAAASARGGLEFRVLWDRRENVLAPGENVLGRTHEAAVWVDHGSVSRRHAVIRIAGAQAILEDCGSKNGTFLRGLRLDAPAALCDGDEILLGRARLLFRAYPAEIPTATVTDGA
jgi:DNA-binding winged helix-turn-helix (wHTH) protein